MRGSSFLLGSRKHTPPHGRGGPLSNRTSVQLRCRLRQLEWITIRKHFVNPFWGWHSIRDTGNLAQNVSWAFLIMRVIVFLYTKHQVLSSLPIILFHFHFYFIFNWHTILCISLGTVWYTLCTNAYMMHYIIVQMSCTNQSGYLPHPSHHTPFLSSKNTQNQLYLGTVHRVLLTVLNWLGKRPLELISPANCNSVFTDRPLHPLPCAFPSLW